MDLFELQRFTLKVKAYWPDANSSEIKIYQHEGYLRATYLGA